MMGPTLFHASANASVGLSVVRVLPSSGAEPPQLCSGHQRLCVPGARGQLLPPHPGAEGRQGGGQL